MGIQRDRNRAATAVLRVNAFFEGEGAEYDGFGGAGGAGEEKNYEEAPKRLGSLRTTSEQDKQILF